MFRSARRTRGAKRPGEGLDREVRLLVSCGSSDRQSGRRHRGRRVSSSLAQLVRRSSADADMTQRKGQCAARQPQVGAARPTSRC